MASVDPVTIKKVAIQAMFWEDKYIQSKSWFANKNNMYYEGDVQDSYYCSRRKKKQFKIVLSADNSVVWLNDDELILYDFVNKPSSALLVEESESEKSTDEDSDNTTQVASPPKKKKMHKNVYSVLKAPQVLQLFQGKLLRNILLTN